MAVDLDTLSVSARRPCTTCEAVGGVLTAEWKDFYRWRRGQNAHELDSLNFKPEEHYFLGVRDLDAVPPMRERCPTCDGDGVETRLVAMADIRDELMSAVQAPAINSAELREVQEDLRTVLARAAARCRGLDPDSTAEQREQLRVAIEAAEALRSTVPLGARRDDR